MINIPKSFQTVLSIVMMLVVLWVVNQVFSSDKNDLVMFDQDNDNYVRIDRSGTVIDCRDDDPLIHPGAFDVPDDKIDQDCVDGDATLFGHDGGTGGDAGKIIELYKNFVFSETIDTDSIVRNSRVIRTEGKFAYAKLNVRADASEFNLDPDREHTVYFYVDNGINGGHLAEYRDGKVHGLFSGTADDDYTYEQPYDLSSLDLFSLNSDTYKNLNVVEILNIPGEHYIGAFVATGRFGILKELSVSYGCEPSSDCTIELVR